MGVVDQTGRVIQRLQGAQRSENQQEAGNRQPSRPQKDANEGLGGYCQAEHDGNRYQPDQSAGPQVSRPEALMVVGEFGHCRVDHLAQHLAEAGKRIGHQHVSHLVKAERRATQEATDKHVVSVPGKVVQHVISAQMRAK